MALTKFAYDMTNSIANFAKFASVVAITASGGGAAAAIPVIIGAHMCLQMFSGVISAVNMVADRVRRVETTKYLEEISSRNVHGYRLSDRSISQEQGPCKDIILPNQSAHQRIKQVLFIKFCTDFC